MDFMKTIKNSLPASRNAILNSIDRGVGVLGISLTSSTGNKLKDLTDLTIVNKNIANARRAFEIDPTVRSSTLSMLILANGEWEIEGTKDASEEAIKHIKRKAKEWDLNQIINGLLMKSVVDGKSFIQKKFQPNDITAVNFLAYDEQTYNFIELKNPFTGVIDGYMQKARIYPYPKDWKSKKFDELANREGEDKETAFDPDQIIYPKLFDDGSSPVYGALDDVYCLKLIKNYGPTIIKRALMTLAVEVGTKEIPNPFKDAFSPTDTYEEKMAKTEVLLAKIGGSFTKKEEKDTITHSYGSRPYMIGDGKVIDITSYTDFYKQEIKEALLTPDSRFNSASTNKSTAETQLGNKGQGTVIEFLQDHVNQYLRPYLFDDQLNRAKYVDDIGQIGLKFTALETEDDLNLAQVAEKLEAAYPSPDQNEKDLRIQTYFPKFYTTKQNYLADLNSKEDGSTIVNSIKPTNQGFIESQTQTNNLIDSWKKYLISEGIVKAAG